MRMKWWGAILLVASLAFIATATLTPGDPFAPGVLRPDFWCFACGNEGAADLTLNIALFVPFGIAIALLGVSPLRALVVGMLLSMAIEGAQHYGLPPNRIASAADLVTNTTGAFLGAILGWYRATWIRPTPRVARILTVVGIAKVVAFMCFTAWALGPDLERELPSDMPLALQVSKVPFTPGYGWFHGEVNSVTVGGQTFAHEDDGPVILHGIVSQQLTGFVQLFGGDERNDFIPMLYVHDSRIASPELMIGQQGPDAMLRVSLRGQRLHFPSPSLPLRNAFRLVLAQSQMIRFSVTPTRWTLTSLNSVKSIESALPISLSLGWTLVQTVVHVGDPFGIAVTIVWLGVFWFPIGYWIVMAAENRKPVFVAAGYAVLALTLWLVPAAFGIAKCGSLDWLSAIAGMSVGVVLAVVQRPNHSTVASEIPAR